MSNTAQHFDVLIIGAGISGIGSATHLKTQCPEKSFCVLEGMESYGGTWLMHNYPGVRSDSDLFTFGYRFKAWTGKPIASGKEILDYMGEVIEENDLAPHMRYNQHIVSANWSNDTQLWTLTATNKESGETLTYTTNFLWMNQGYYKHAKGYTPEWPGMDRFKGPIVHPQTWPKELDYKGTHGGIIGSGATTATVAPAIAGECEHVTVLQRSPTYFVPRPNNNELTTQLRELGVDEEVVHDITRRQVLKEQQEVVNLSRLYPDAVKTALIDGVKACLPKDYDVDTHFTPNYRPWRQRIAVVPDGDLFKGITAGKASMVTDVIDTFTEKGLLLESGKELEADIILTATGFNLSVLGGIRFSVDDKEIDFADSVTYRGMMFTGLPNMAWVMGYFRASWTLRVDLIGDFICRLLKHMDAKGVKQVSLTVPEEDKDMELLPWGDEEEFNPSYLLRSMHLLPKRGNTANWQHTQDYWEERELLPSVDLDENIFVYN
jgi:cation diffusion facilitator CzcD-associated flavoprotein CzcO